MGAQRICILLPAILVLLSLHSAQSSSNTSNVTPTPANTDSSPPSTPRPHQRKLKVLVISPEIAFSHMQFTGRLADLLSDAGHEVHVLILEMSQDLRNYTGVHRGQLVRRLPAPASAGGSGKEAPHLFDSDPFAGPKSLLAVMSKIGSLDGVSDAHFIYFINLIPASL